MVFFAIGFETTAPGQRDGGLIRRARKALDEFFDAGLARAGAALDRGDLAGAGNRVQAFLGPGHVCAIIGFREYSALAARYRVPIVITGFEPVDLLRGMLMTVAQLEAGRAEVENAYERTVAPDGNPRRARAHLRGLRGRSIASGAASARSRSRAIKLRYEYRAHDAERLFEVDAIATDESGRCISGQVLRGLKKPCDCPAFGKRLHARTPLGATMVSAEGACAAYYQYGRYLRREVA